MQNLYDRVIKITYDLLKQSLKVDNTWLSVLTVHLLTYETIEN
jgi:hypothetical protein